MRLRRLSTPPLIRLSGGVHSHGGNANARASSSLPGSHIALHAVLKNQHLHHQRNAHKSQWHQEQQRQEKQHEQQRIGK